MQYNHIPDSECLMRNLRAESRGVRTNFPWYFTTVEQLRDQRWLLSSQTHLYVHQLPGSLLRLLYQNGQFCPPLLQPSPSFLC